MNTTHTEEDAMDTPQAPTRVVAVGGWPRGYDAIWRFERAGGALWAARAYTQIAGIETRVVQLTFDDWDRDDRWDDWTPGYYVIAPSDVAAPAKAILQDPAFRAMEPARLWDEAARRLADQRANA